MHYILLNGCPAIVMPAKIGAPLIAWDCLTLEQLWDVELPKETEGMKTSKSKFMGIVNVLFEYLDLCVDWERFIVGCEGPTAGSDGRGALKAAITLFVGAAVRSGQSKEVRREVDKERSGIAMWRIP
jgi:hypothetical protein